MLRQLFCVKSVSGILAVATTVFGVAFSYGIASSQTARSLVQLKPTSAQRLQAVTAQLRGPKRVVRLPVLTASPKASARQNVVALKRITTADPRMSTLVRAFWIEGASGDVTPHGTITVRGTGFGSSPSDVQMIGYFPDFPDRTVHLLVTSWSDTSITASIPAISNAPDQVVTVQLSRTDRSFSGDHSQPIASKTILSNDIVMRFVATRQTILARVGWLADTSCGDNIGNAFTADNEDMCGEWQGLPGTTWDFSGRGDYSLTAFHDRPRATTGDDEYHTTLPAGWSFDRIEFVDNSPETDIVITPTMDPTHVSWRVHWKTQHVNDRFGAREEAAYGMATYVTGPAGDPFVRAGGP